MALSERAKLIAELSLEDKLSKGLGTAAKNVSKFESGLGRAGKGAAQLGKGVLKAGTIVAGVAATGFVLATKTAIDFDDAFASVRKTVSASPAELQALNDQLHSLATRIPVPYTDLASIAAEAGALGVPTRSVAKFTETVARLSASTQGLSVDQAAEAFGKFRNTLKLSDGDLTNAASSLIALGNAGASSEGDIIEVAKRFGAAGHQAGLSAAQVLGFSSAIASLGVEPEAAGSSLSRLFNNITKYLGTGNKKIDAFAKTTGVSVATFKKSFTKDAGGTVEAFLTQLGKLDKYKAAAVLKNAGITNVRDINAVLLLSQNVGELKRQVNLSSDAFRKNTDLTDVSNQRFDTLKNKIQLVKQGLYEAGYNLSEGFLPALGRAADKLTKFLQLPSNKHALQDIGRELGDTLDKIDFDKLLTAAKGAADVLKPLVDSLITLAGALNVLPANVKGAAAGLLVANKLSGGAIASGAGNIVGGLAESLTKTLGSKIPILGKAFVQPVFVTNIGAGGLGGGGGVPGGAAPGGLGSKLAKAGAAAAIGFDVVSVVATQQEISGQISQQANDLKAQLASGIKVQTPAQLQTSLDAVNQGINDIQANPLNVLVQGSALDSLKDMKASLEAQIHAGDKPTSVLGKGFGPAIAGALTKALPALKIPKLNQSLDRDLAKLASLQGKLHQAKESGDKGRAAALKARVDTLGRRVDSEKRALVTVQNQVKNATKGGLNTLGGIERTGNAIVGSGLSDVANRIVAAIYANKPVINATTIVRSTVRNGRAGPSGGSSNTNRLGQYASKPS